jgi:DNA polymerase-3 subunit delta'
VFEVVPGQGRVKRMLERALREERLSHAYLFVGQEGLGKLALARELAVALVAGCGDCGDCDDCARARRGLHPDLVTVEPEGEQIRRDQIDRIVAELALRPFAAARRVWVLPECERLTDEAANKLLKSLEEPPAHVYFLLVSDRLERVKPTVVSRCQLVELSPLSDEELADHLRAVYGLEDEEADTLARLSRGSVDRAARLADDARGPRRRHEYIEQAARLVDLVVGGSERATQRPGEAFIAALEAQAASVSGEVGARLAAQKTELEQMLPAGRERARALKDAEARARREELRLRRLAALDAVDLLTSWLRDLLVASCGAPATIWNVDRRRRIEEGALPSPDVTRRLLAVVSATRNDLYLNIDQKLAFQAMVARFEEVTET